jgi:hypothetical protein
MRGEWVKIRKGGGKVAGEEGLMLCKELLVNNK